MNLWNSFTIRTVIWNPVYKWQKWKMDRNLNNSVDSWQPQPYIGKNEDIIQTHVKAIKWLKQQGYVINGPISEEYIVSPIDVSEVDDHITKVIIPIEKA